MQQGKIFRVLSRAGRVLVEIHLNYETQEPPAQVEVIGGGDFLVTPRTIGRPNMAIVLQFGFDLEFDKRKPGNFRHCGKIAEDRVLNDKKFPTNSKEFNLNCTLT